MIATMEAHQIDFHAASLSWVRTSIKSISQVLIIQNKVLSTPHSILPVWVKSSDCYLPILAKMLKIQSIIKNIIKKTIMLIKYNHVHV